MSRPRRDAGAFAHNASGFPRIRHGQQIRIRLLHLGTWHLALGTWHLALGTWHLALGTWHLALGTSLRGAPPRLSELMPKASFSTQRAPSPLGDSLLPPETPNPLPGAGGSQVH